LGVAASGGIVRPVDVGSSEVALTGLWWSRFVNDFDLVLDGNRQEGTKLIIPTGGGGEQLPWLQYLEDRPYLPRGRMNHR